MLQVAADGSFKSVAHAGEAAAAVTERLLQQDVQDSARHAALVHQTRALKDDDVKDLVSSSFRESLPQ